MSLWGKDDFNTNMLEAERFSMFYDTEVELLTTKAPELSSLISSANRVVDMGCGIGASILLARKISPDAEIISVDNQLAPLPEVIRKAGDKFVEHFSLSFDKFLRKSLPADIYLFCKSSHSLSSENTVQLSRCLNQDGIVLIFGGEDGLPSNWNDYFETIAFDGGYPPGKYIIAAYKRLTNRQ